MGLKQKAFSGVVWNGVGAASQIALEFVFGIVLARLLSPTEFGLIGIVSIFLILAEVFINSGLRQALVQQQDCSQTEYSTVFWLNMVLGLGFTLLLWLSSPLIAAFFREQELVWVVRALAFSVLISSVTLVQRVIVAKQLAFKSNARILIVSSIISGSFAVYLAYTGFGVWSLVAKTLSRDALQSLQYWLLGNWRPVWQFSQQAAKKLGTFGVTMLGSNLLFAAARNLHNAFISKSFSITSLGFFSRSELFANMGSLTITAVFADVGFPVLASVKEDKFAFRAAFRRLVLSNVFVTTFCMLGMIAIAKPMMLALLGEKWVDSIQYLQLLCLVGLFTPVKGINMMSAVVVGQPGLFFRFEMIDKMQLVYVICVGYFFGISSMIVAMMVNAILSWIITAQLSSELTGYGLKDQAKDLFQIIGIASLMALVVGCIGYFWETHPMVEFLMLTLVGGLLSYVLCEIFKPEPYVFMKEMVTERIQGLGIFTKSLS